MRDESVVLLVGNSAHCYVRFDKPAKLEVVPKESFVCSSWMKAIVLLNLQAGKAIPGPVTERDRAAELRSMLQHQGIATDVHTVVPNGVARMVSTAVAQRPDAIIVGGGDGTISSVVTEMWRSGIPLGVIPLGTLNHFAKDVGIPLAVADAVRVIAGGHTREVDLGEVNGRAFINNASIGLYPKVVLDRDAQRERLGRGKWLAMLFALLKTLRRHSMLRVRIVAQDKAVLRNAPFVFVGNNAYDMSLFRVGSRPRLDEGQLSLYTANRTGRFGLVRMSLRALLGRLEQDRDFHATLHREVWIETGQEHLHVALDGEVNTMHPPLHFRALPKALRLLAPATT